MTYPEVKLAVAVGATAFFWYCFLFGEPVLANFK